MSREKPHLTFPFDADLREKILDVPIAHRETEIEPNGLSNDVGMEAVAAV